MQVGICLSERQETHRESSMEVPISNNNTLFIVRSTEAPFSKRLSEIVSLCFFAFVKNRDWMALTRFGMESCEVG